MNISLTIQDNEFFVLIGSSGCGKTTLLKTLNKLNPIDKGEILINGTPINRIKVTQLPRLMGYVVQEGGLFPHMTVEDNIALAMRVAGYPKEKLYDRITELLELVNRIDENAFMITSDATDVHGEGFTLEFKV